MGHRQYSVSNTNAPELHAQLLSISLSKDEEDWKNIYHTHHFTEIFYVVDGKGLFILKDKPHFPIQKGDLVIIPPHMEHTERSVPGMPLEYYVLGIDGVVLLSEDQNPYTHMLCNFSSSEFINILFEQMLHEMHNHAYGDNSICQKLLEILLIKIVRTQHLQPVATSTRRMSKECAKIKEYLDTHYSEHITLDSLTNLTHMNKYYMAHSFTKYTGLSPIQYLNEVRLKTACGLLEKTDLSISDISSTIGFSSPSYFTQSFHKKYQITPIKYRKNCENEDS